MIIEKNVPMPEAGRGRDATSKYPFGSMEVGDSFHVPRTRSVNVSSAGHTWRKKTNRLDVQFSVRTENGGTRIRRTA